MASYSAAARSAKPDLYQQVTTRIVEALERGVVPWRCPWDRYRGLPRNLTSGKDYRGVNVFLLSLVRHCSGYESPYWLTCKQAQAAGGHVRKGEKGTGVVFWKWFDKDTGRTDDDGEPVKDRLPVLRHYTVFNVDQCDGIEPPETEGVSRHDWQPLAECERVVETMPDRPEVREGTGRACYIPSADRVEMPHRHRFAQPEAWYGTLFHELTHATGHEKRLNRRPSDDKCGRVWIVNEAHLLTPRVVGEFLTLLEALPAHVAIVFTTKVEGDSLFSDEQIDSHPFKSRCQCIGLAQRGIAEPFAERCRAIALAEGLDGKPVSAYVRLLQDCRNNMRATG